MNQPVRRLCASLFFCVAAAGASGQEQSVPAPPGAKLVLQATAQGVQIYACKKDIGTDRWVFIAPEAALFDATGQQIGTHFAGPTWQMADGSQIVGEIAAQAPAPEQDAIAWLMLRVKSRQGSGVLAGVSTVRRIDTHGGKAPATDCDEAQRRVPYTARYLFYSSEK